MSVNTEQFDEARIASRDARIAELEVDANLFVLLHALAIEEGWLPDPGESAYDLLQRAIMAHSPRSRARPVP